MKILVIDDHVSFCEGLIAALGYLRPDYEVHFESDAELVPESLLGKSDYDLFILDVIMPGLGGVELIKYLNKRGNETPVGVMSSITDIDVIQQLFQLGIVGYLPKSYSIYQIIGAIEQCRTGDIHVPYFVRSDVRAGAESNRHRDSRDDCKEAERIAALKPLQLDSGVRLTRRQVEIISLMDQGLSNQEIADTLFITKATVKTHLHHLFKAFNVNNRISCLRAAKKAGLAS